MIKKLDVARMVYLLNDLERLNNVSFLKKNNFWIRDRYHGINILEISPEETRRLIKDRKDIITSELHKLGVSIS